MKSSKMSILVSLVSLLVIIGIVWLLLFSKSVIWSFKESGSVSSIHSFVIFNPFREKKSEAEAENFLNLLKNEGCEKAVLNLKSERDYKDICEKESLYKLENWELSNRKDTEHSVKLYYRVKRTSYSGYDGQLWLDIEKASDGWTVTDINSIY